MENRKGENMLHLKTNAIWLFLLLTSVSIVACAPQRHRPASIYDALADPPHEIMITTGDFNHGYKILGNVTCEIGSISAWNSTQQNEGYLDEVCAKEAYAKYGLYANAIINMEYRESLGDTFISSLATSTAGARMGKIWARGVAVHINEMHDQNNPDREIP